MKRRFKMGAGGDGLTGSGMGGTAGSGMLRNYGTEEDIWYNSQFSYLHGWRTEKNPLKKLKKWIIWMNQGRKIK